jgi:hypothetical protein
MTPLSAKPDAARISRRRQSDSVSFYRYLTSDGQEMLLRADKVGYEGNVSKDVEARCRVWVPLR